MNFPLMAMATAACLLGVFCLPKSKARAGVFDSHGYHDHDGEKKKKKKKKQRNKRQRPRHSHRSGSHHHHHGHSHGHHGHDHQSGFGLGLGTSITHSFGGSSSATSTSPDGADPHAGHNHALWHGLSLHGGDGHDHGGHDHGTESETGGPGMTLFVQPQYRWSNGFGTNVTLSYMPSLGLLDPTAAVDYTLEMTRRLSLNLLMSLAAPFSETSRKTNKLTTATFQAGPSYQVASVTFSVLGTASFSFYKEPSAVENEHHIEGEEDHDHEHEEDEHHIEGEEDHDHEHEEIEALDPGREKTRFGGQMNVAYSLWKLRTEHGIGAFWASSEFGIDTFTTEAIILRLTFPWNSFDVSGWLSTTGSATTGLTMPTSPSVGAGLTFTY